MKTTNDGNGSGTRDNVRHTSLIGLFGVFQDGQCGRVSSSGGGAVAASGSCTVIVVGVGKPLRLNMTVQQLSGIRKGERHGDDNDTLLSRGVHY